MGREVARGARSDREGFGGRGIGPGMKIKLERREKEGLL